MQISYSTSYTSRPLPSLHVGTSHLLKDETTSIYGFHVKWGLSTYFLGKNAFQPTQINKALLMTKSTALTEEFKNNSMAFAWERTIQTEQPPLVGEASANF
jgi:hypothetical protein